METLNDKFSIKNLLFSKALPNYVIPVPVNGHKVYSCTDCGDKFVFESSFNDHINRKSMKISYMCRYCNQSKIFFNRCNLLFHIRSHVFKTATINVTDLKIEPLPFSEFKTLHTDSLHTSFTSAITTHANTSDINSISADVTHSNLLNASSISAATNETAATTNEKAAAENETAAAPRKPTTSVFCFECKINLTNTGIAYKDRASHFMQYSNEVFSCPVCLFALPSICALKTHLRLHLKCPPYFCPECGAHLANKNVNYPYSHDCEGFKMMRATSRLNCIARNCRLFHPNDYKDHMKEYHLKKVYKCPYCVVACFNEITMQKHLKCHKTATNALIFYQCELCPGKFVMQSHIETHIKSHISVSRTASIFPCWPCGSIFKDVSVLLTHFKRKHNSSDTIKMALTSILSEFEMYSTKPKRIYRVVKRCDQCKRSFTYKCKYEEIHILPNECPYKCTSTLELDVSPDQIQNNKITCHLCETQISQDWDEIKRHYGALHKMYKCMDAEIVLTRIDIQKYLPRDKIPSSRSSLKTIGDTNRSGKIKKRRRNKTSKSAADGIKVVQVTQSHESKPGNFSDSLYKCKICGDEYEDKLSLEKHLKHHKDPCMAYQCMECGQSFVVKPSFSKHLLLEHGISNTEDYISNKQCYNANALMKYQGSIVTSNEPLAENQCTICREHFEGQEDLEKHFRVHGMAFLMKNTSIKAHNIV